MTNTLFLVAGQLIDKNLNEVLAQQGGVALAIVCMLLIVRMASKSNSRIKKAE